MREKLIELLQSSPTDAMGNHGVGALADYLIQNGVTIQKWIPVSERLPEQERTVLVIDRVTGEITTAHLNFFDSFVFEDGRGHGASYWMPLPEPPKEVER